MNPDSQIPPSAPTQPPAPAPVPGPVEPSEVPGGAGQAPVAGVPPAAVPSGQRSKLPLIIGGLAGLIVLIGVVLAGMHFLGGPITYSTKDLLTAKAKNYSISYPKQWQDVSGNSKLISNVTGNVNSGFEDMKAYAYKVDKQGNQARSLLLVGDENSGITDYDLNNAVRDSKLKDQLTAQFAKDFKVSKPSDVGCKSVANQQETTAYNTRLYIAQVTLNYDCVPNVGLANQSYHVALLAGFIDDKIFLTVVSTQQADWQRNSGFYKNNLVVGLQPK